MRVATILGTGLIGASIGMELRRLEWEVVGWDPDPESLRLALERGALDRTAAASADAVAGAGFVVLAGPLPAVIGSLPTLRTEALVTDVASVKEPVVAAAPSGLRFVGGHPMAGREHAGPGAASHSLFRGAAWVITTDGASRRDIDMLASIVSSMGAVPREMTAAEHDVAVAKVSHLPHMLAAALLGGIGRGTPAETLAAGSFRDLTRVATSDTGWWPDVLAANAQQVDGAIDELITELETLRRAVRAADTRRLASLLAHARDQRIAMAPAQVRVRVVLQDKPGEIAAVGHALERSAVDVRDLQLRHAPHGGGGVLTLTVRPGESEPLREALRAEGFEVE